MIAIENVRLFQELETRTRELARSVEELKALGEVGQAVSSTLDLQTVLNTIVRHAVQLSGTDCGIIYEYDEPTQEFHLRGQLSNGRGAGQRAIRQPRSVSDKGLPAEQRKRGVRRTKLPISVRSTNSLPEGCAPS